MKRLIAILAIGFLGFTTGPAPAQSGREPLPISQIKLPPGFQISVLVDDVPGARSLTMSPEGTLFVGSKDEGKVYAVSGIAAGAPKTTVIARGLKQPNGVAFRDGALYVAEISRITRFDAIQAHLADPPKGVVVNADYPKDAWHGWKFIAFGPDGKLYIPIGAPCNVCNREKDPEPYASITRINPANGSGMEIVARGVRNTVGFDWHPETKELWFTDNGRDMLGEDIPPDELNHVTKTGQHFGFPYCHGKGVKDPEFAADKSCGTDGEFTQPVQALGPHVAALGMRFYTGKMFPQEYKHQVFIAEHGSWNRSKPIGYRVSLVRFTNGKPTQYETFAEGWLKNGQAWGRPVDVLVAQDGALLVSDDQAGVIYRISRK